MDPKTEALSRGIHEFKGSRKKLTALFKIITQKAAEEIDGREHDATYGATDMFGNAREKKGKKQIVAESVAQARCGDQADAGQDDLFRASSYPAGLYLLRKSTGRIHGNERRDSAGKAQDGAGCHRAGAGHEGRLEKAEESEEARRPNGEGKAGDGSRRGAGAVGPYLLRKSNPNHGEHGHFASHNIDQDVANFELTLNAVKDGTHNMRQPAKVMQHTPEVLRQLGAKDREIDIDPNDIKKIILSWKQDGGKHGIPVETVKNIPKWLADPIMVFDSNTQRNSLVILTEAEHENQPIYVAIHLEKDRGRKHYVNRVASTYQRPDTDVERWVKAGLLRCYDNKKGSEWLRARGLQLPTAGTSLQSLSKKTLLLKSKNVNKSLRARSAVLNRKTSGKAMGFQLPNQHVNSLLAGSADPLGSKERPAGIVGQVLHDVGLKASGNRTEACPVEVFRLEINSSSQSHNTLLKSESPSDGRKPPVQHDVPMLLKAHVAAYSRTTASGAVAYVREHEDSRVKAYGRKLYFVRNHSDLHSLRQARFGHLPNWGQLSEHDRNKILDAEEEVHRRLKEDDAVKDHAKAKERERQKEAMRSGKKVAAKDLVASGLAEKTPGREVQLNMFNGKRIVGVHLIKSVALSNHPGYVLRTTHDNEGHTARRWFRAGSPEASKAGDRSAPGTNVANAMLQVPVPAFASDSATNQGTRRRVEQLRQS